MVPGGVRITWTAPAFGVVQTYTIYRSSNGATPIVIGSVSGVNGNPPATEFTDTNPDLTSATVVYTVSTTLVPDASGPARQSAPSTQAVMKTDQTIVLGPLPSSVPFGTPTTVTATAMTGGKANGLQVSFSAAGSCVIGSQSILSSVSTASVTLSTTGTCTVTASQPGATTFNAANSVSGTFMVLPKGSTLGIADNQLHAVAERAVWRLVCGEREVFCEPAGHLECLRTLHDERRYHRRWNLLDYGLGSGECELQRGIADAVVHHLPGSPEGCG